MPSGGGGREGEVGGWMCGVLVGDEGGGGGLGGGGNFDVSFLKLSFDN